MLTQSDFDQLEKLMDEKVKEGIGLLPTKEEFFKKMDEVMGELKGIRESNTILNERTSKHTDEIEELQKIHPNNNHVLTS